MSISRKYFVAAATVSLFTSGNVFAEGFAHYTGYKVTATALGTLVDDVNDSSSSYWHISAENAWKLKALGDAIFGQGDDKVIADPALYLDMSLGEKHGVSYDAVRLGVAWRMDFSELNPKPSYSPGGFPDKPTLLGFVESSKIDEADDRVEISGVGLLWAGALKSGSPEIDLWGDLEYLSNTGDSKVDSRFTLDLSLPISDSSGQDRTWEIAPRFVYVSDDLADIEQSNDEYLSFQVSGRYLLWNNFSLYGVAGYEDDSAFDREGKFVLGGIEYMVLDEKPQGGGRGRGGSWYRP